MAAERDIPAEPPDGTALYWPETAEEYARLMVRDDAAARATDLGPDHARWWAPNSFDIPLTWQQVCEVLSRSGAARQFGATPLASAIRLTAAERTERPS